MRLREADRAQTTQKLVVHVDTFRLLILIIMVNH